MELTVLGTDGAFPRAGGACSGYLLRHDGFSLVIDLGTGALANLQRHVGYDRIDAVVLSHEHPDHCVDVYPLFVARQFHEERLAPLPLFAPPGAFDRLARLAGTESGDDFRAAFRVTEVEPGSGFGTGPFRIATRPMPHLVPNLGMR
ncbi:MAG: MBL fold metallo-hydrolase, partial [Actinobacteria bacterium]|nr:MBL fold metallo-hydrolase [Actinomycetota bacterium]